MNYKLIKSMKNERVQKGRKTRDNILGIKQISGNSSVTKMSPLAGQLHWLERCPGSSGLWLLSPGGTHTRINQ